MYTCKYGLLEIDRPLQCKFLHLHLDSQNETFSSLQFVILELLSSQRKSKQYLCLGTENHICRIEMRARFTSIESQEKFQPPGIVVGQGFLPRK